MLEKPEDQNENLRTQYQAHYRLALQLACQNRVNSALKSVQKALSLNADCGPAFLLLQLLFSVDAKAPVVLEGATCGLKRWPNLAGFHVLSAKLMIESGNSAGALEICRDWIQQVFFKLLEFEKNLNHWQSDSDDRDLGDHARGLILHSQFIL